jgi:hypothetical protein
MKRKGLPMKKRKGLPMKKKIAFVLRHFDPCKNRMLLRK